MCAVMFVLKNTLYFMFYLLLYGVAWAFLMKGEEYKYLTWITNKLASCSIIEVPSSTYIYEWVRFLQLQMVLFNWAAQIYIMWNCDFFTIGIGKKWNSSSLFSCQNIPFNQCQSFKNSIPCNYCLCLDYLFHSRIKKPLWIACWTPN